MLRRDKADELYSIMLKRYKEERPEVRVTNTMMSIIWHSVYKELCRNGEEAARKYAKTNKLLDDKIVIVNVNEVDDYECTCGNNVGEEGFSPCDKNGNEIEPIEGWEGMYVCLRCGKLSTVKFN